MGENDKRMKLRYAGTCRVCGTQLPARGDAIYERDTRTVRCVTCGESPEPVAEPEPTAEQAFSAGASARREYERRMAAREARVRERFPRIGGLLLAAFDEDQSIKAWQVGAVGEERLGESLDTLVDDGIAVLHDLGVPGSRANIDHLAITPGGVWVIDAKKYKGRPAHKIEGGLLRPRVEKLTVAGRDRTKLVDGVLRQVGVVSEIVPDVPVQGVLCFVDADWPLVGGSFSIREVRVTWPRRLRKLVGESTGPVDVEETTLRLLEELRPA